MSKLTEQQKQQVSNWLNVKGVGIRGACSLCGSKHWSIDETIHEIREFNGGGLIVGGPITPVILITCDNCGHTSALSAVMIGVVPRE